MLNEQENSLPELSLDEKIKEAKEKYRKSLASFILIEDFLDENKNSLVNVFPWALSMFSIALNDFCKTDPNSTLTYTNKTVTLSNTATIVMVKTLGRIQTYYIQNITLKSAEIGSNSIESVQQIKDSNWAKGYNPFSLEYFEPLLVQNPELLCFGSKKIKDEELINLIKKHKIILFNLRDLDDEFFPIVNEKILLSNKKERLSLSEVEKIGYLYPEFVHWFLKQGIQLIEPLHEKSGDEFIEIRAALFYGFLNSTKVPPKLEYKIHDYYQDALNYKTDGEFQKKLNELKIKNPNLDVWITEDAEDDYDCFHSLNLFVDEAISGSIYFNGSKRELEHRTDTNTPLPFFNLLYDTLCEIDYKNGASDFIKKLSEIRKKQRFIEMSDSIKNIELASPIKIKNSKRI